MRARSLTVVVALMWFLGATSFVPAKTRVVTGDELWQLFDKKMYPIYPYEARRAHQQGSGLYRMYINPDGSVHAVGVMKSTGSKALDLAAAGGLGHCHLKPTGHAFEIDMPITFTLAGFIR